jgi:hypothetical protein
MLGKAKGRHLRESLKLIRVFLASPGDLKEERLAARDAADEINRLVAKPAGYQIELLGWEETVSSLGRPQALINKELETCELFVGIMWKRWGTPPSKDGPYSSGFEEEYELSRKRFAETGEPQMGMFFKNVDRELLADPGDDLKRVLGFQNRLTDEKAHLFQMFDTKEEFAQRVRQFLAAHVHLRTARDAKEEEQREGAPKELRTDQEAQNGHAQAATGGLSTEPMLDGAFLANLATRLHQDGEITDVEVARLRLVAVSVKGSGNDDVELGVHDANLLYRHRQAVDFSDREVNALARAGLANTSSENVPFWTWYAISSAKNSLFLPFTSYIGTEDEQVGALEVMRELSFQRDEDSNILSRIRASWFELDSPKRVKTAALRYLRENGSIEDAPVIEEEIGRSSSDTLQPAIEAQAAIYLRHDPATAARSLLNAALETIDPALLREVLPAMSQLKDEEVQLGLSHRNAQVRLHALGLLSSRQRLDEAALRLAAEDDDSLVRLRAVELLDEMVGPIDLKEAAMLFQVPRRGPYLGGLLSSLKEIDQIALQAFKRRRFMQCDTEALKRIANGESSDKHLAMFCLASRNVGKSKQDLRNLIDDGFRAYVAEHWPDGVPGQNQNSILFGQSRNPEESKRRELMRSALDVLEENPDPVDLERVRRVIDNDTASIIATDLRFISRFGDESDTRRVIEAFKRSFSSALGVGPRPNLSQPAAQALLRIVDEPWKLLEVELPPTILKTVLVLYPATPFAKLSDVKLTELLLNASDAVRKAAAIKCLLVLSKRRISQLLGVYLERERQFYNVIHWLDLGVAESRSVARAVAIRATRELS